MNQPVWQPKHPEQTRMFKFMQFAQQKSEQRFADYQDLYNWSISEPGQFWQILADFLDIRFTSKARQVLQTGTHFIDAQWFCGATLNFAEQLLSRNDEHPALVSILENGKKQIISYNALNQHVAQCAEGLRQAGIKPGDRVAAIMPNVPMTIIAMLATASLGAIWSSCSPDFGAHAAIDRIGQVEPSLLFMVDGHQYQGKNYPAQEKLTRMCQAIPSIKHVVICPIIESTVEAPNVKMTRWQDFLKPAQSCRFEAFAFNHPLYILFSSGTTGKPKCIAHGVGGTLLQHLKELALHSNLTGEDNLCFYTTCGWMMWNWMVSALALGATLTLYEGCPSYPKPDRLLELIDQENVTAFGTSAKFISSMEKAGIVPKEKWQYRRLKTIFSTGSPLLPHNYDYVYEQIKQDVQLSSISGGTDIISCFALGNPMLPVYRGELQCRGLGMAVEVFNEQGQSLIQERGELVCTQPFPSMPVCFWNDPENIKYKHAYFERFENIWAHGDFAEITEHGGMIIYGRSDAVLNPGGVRIGTAEIYRQIENMPEILDSVVIGQNWQDDVRIVLFVQLAENMQLDEALQKQIRQTIRQNASPRHVPAVILQVDDIPKTINGKTVELAVRQAVHGEEIHNLSSLANPKSLAHFRHRVELGE